MAVQDRESQLELFDVTRQVPPRPHREMAGRFLFHLRYDQVMLAAMAVVIGVTVVFACGVERGKQLVRSERVLWARQQPPRPDPPRERTSDAVTKSPAGAAEPGVQTPKESPAKAPATSPKVKAATKLASAAEAERGRAGTSRYAIQVVTYSRVQLARQELERLRARGDRGFLVMSDGHTRVYVGPFPSKANAAEELTRLKARYRDCFVRVL